MKVFDPTAGSQAKGFELAARPSSLHDKVVGLIDNTKPNSDKLLRLVVGLLQEKHGVREVIERRKTAASVPVTDDVLDELTSRCDVVIAGVGD